MKNAHEHSTEKSTNRVQVDAKAAVAFLREDVHKKTVSTPKVHKRLLAVSENNMTIVHHHKRRGRNKLLCDACLGSLHLEQGKEVRGCAMIGFNR